ncbi:phage protein NinX family protein [Morganella morganii]|uniref:phage protein NinX family protein n=1 Tax=Morganella morganii TaxID=582 RepID=UPI0025A8BA61|nr:DUF2591 family protein [Morganella morganii]EKW5729314.1 DUF2591 family protein [Morganella morganii]
MNKYRDKSDFEINKAVAVAIGAKPFPPERTEFKQCEIPGLENAIIVKITGVKTGLFDPCNNPADAMPIVIRSLISLISDKSDDGESAWWVAQDVTGSIASGLKSNPYRAAMEVFLMMKDAENES